MRNPTSDFRLDIQALRGLAIALVMLNHARLGGFEAGYLGVDIFFVISGFLVTGMIVAECDRGRFSIAGFYFRRAKRLLPAAYATLIVCTLVAPFVLSDGELRDYVRQVLGTVSFTANLVLLTQANYFDGPAELKPLLHTWSLSIEEQYYLVLPLLLIATPARLRLRVLGGLTALSLLACIVLVTYKPVAAFYLLPTRAWELGLGSLGALLQTHALLRDWARRLCVPALAVLLLGPMLLPASLTHPGGAAVAVCLATLLLILARHEAAGRLWPVKLLGGVGNASYSLYLVHWPLLAFLNNAYIGKPPLADRLVALLLAALLGYLLYRGVEHPLHRASFGLSRRAVAITAATSATVMLLPLGIASAHGARGPDYQEILRPVVGFSASCESASPRFAPPPICRSTAAPKLLVWGDSFAQHLIPGLSATFDGGVQQATRSFCGPLIGLAPMSSGEFNQAWAENCLRFNQSVLQFVQASRNIEYVVLSSPFTQYIGEYQGRQLLVERDGQLAVLPPDVGTTAQALSETVRALHRLGKKVLLVAPPPTAPFHIGNCLEKKAKGQLMLGPDRDCRIRLDEYRSRQHLLLELLVRAETDPEVAVLRFIDTLCPDGRSCDTEAEGVFIYRDSGHFSHAGSELVARRLGFGERLRREAR